MASKKIPIGLNPAEAEVEQRVEAMMAPVKIKIVDHDDSPASVPATKLPSANEATTADASPAPIDIFSDPKTAPAVPTDLLAQLNATVPDDQAADTAPAEAAAVEESKAVAEPPVKTAKKVVVSHEDDEVTVTPTVVPPVETTAPAAPTPPPVPAGPPVRVPQLIASTAPKPAPLVAASSKELTTPDAAPTFAIAKDDETEATDSQPAEVLPVPPLQLDDAKTDAAIASIAASEGDELLAAQDAANQQADVVPKKAANQPRPLVKRLAWLLIAAVLVLIALAAIPATRYKLAGLVVKQDLSLTIRDSKTNRPVSKAIVTIDGTMMMTDATGVAHLNVPVGTHQVSVTKQYYADESVSTFVSFKKGAPLAVSLVATGRQVPIKITDKITGKPLVGAEVSVLKTSAKTDKLGRAIIVLPTKTKTVAGTISDANFNTAQVTIEVTDSEVPANDFTLTAAGKIYFLSNEQGTIDVVKTNLDGTGRQTVVKGTGKEDPNTTVLLTARDWHFSVLKAQRDSSQAAMYLLDSTNDKLVEFDSGDANFTPIGWSGHYFMYDAVRNTVATSQNSHELLKSYDAERGQLNQLDASQANSEGSGYVYQGFYNFNILDNLLVYNTQWYSSGGASLAAKTDTIRGVLPTGQNKKDYQNIPAAGLGYIQAALTTPQDIYFSAFNYVDSKTSYYEFQNQAMKPNNTVTAASFNKLYPAYVLSPNGKQSLWSEQRDGKSVVLLGDATAATSKVVPSLAGYAAYGWYSDNYLLVTKKGSELYIIASDGSGVPTKLSNYYKPAQNIAGSGSGYGSL